MTRGGALALGAGGAAAHLWAMVRRNRSLEPAPIRDPSGEAYPERDLTLSDGVRVAAVDAGEGEPILLVPGADGVKETFRYQVPAFARRRRVVAADVRSELPAGSGLDRLARDLAEIQDGLGTGPTTVLGQSLGGAIAIRFAVRHPERVRALVLANSLTRVSYEHLGINRTALAPLAMATTRYLPTPLARLCARGWSRAAVWIFDDSPGGGNVVEYALWTGPRTVRPAVSRRRVDTLRPVDLRPELSEVRAPTLVVKGPRDAYCPPEWAREIARGIPGAEYAEIRGTGHCSHISRPGAFNETVLGWLDSAAGRVAGRRGGEGREGGGRA